MGFYGNLKNHRQVDTHTCSCKYYAACSVGLNAADFKLKPMKPMRFNLHSKTHTYMTLGNAV